MFTKLNSIVVAIVFTYFCLPVAIAGNFSTDDSTERLIYQAKLHLTGQRSARSVEDAEPLLQQAARQGSEEAHLILGRIYTRHKEKKDYATASFWLKRAAEQGSTRAMDMMSLIFLDGRVIDPDHSEAAYWIRRGSDAGDLDATYNLAFYYLEGTGVPQNTVRGTDLLKDAAIKGHNYSINYFVEKTRENNSEAKQMLMQIYAEQKYDTEAFKAYRQETY